MRRKDIKDRTINILKNVKNENHYFKDIKNKNIRFNCVRVKLYTPTPGCKSND